MESSRSNNETLETGANVLSQPTNDLISSSSRPLHRPTPLVLDFLNRGNPSDDTIDCFGSLEEPLLESHRDSLLREEYPSTNAIKRDSILLRNPFIMLRRTLSGLPQQQQREDWNNNNNPEYFQDEPPQDESPLEGNRTPHHQHVVWYKNPYQRMAMISNFCTSYNVVNISLVLPILEQVLSVNSSQDTSIVASSLLAGMVLGQLVGGALGDSCLGLVAALRLVMVVQIAASLGSAFVTIPQEQSTKLINQFYFQLALWRFVLGLGAGAVYPLAACLSVEQSGMMNHDHVKSAITRVVATFAIQGIGFWFVPIITLPLLYINSIPLEYTWRIILGLGSIPGFVLLLLQCTLHHHFRKRQHRPTDTLTSLQQPTLSTEGCLPQLHSPSSKEEETVGDLELMCEDSDGEVGTFLDSSPDLSSGGEGCYGVSEPPAIRHGWWESLCTEANLCQKFLGTAVTWFLFDVLFYGNTLFQPIVVETAFGAQHPGQEQRHSLQRTAWISFVLTSIALPGYVVAGLFMGKSMPWFFGEIHQTVRYVMLQGFALMSLLYFVIGFFWNDLRKHPVWLVLLYGLTFFFSNYGPNTTTFVLPSLVYSPECRSTFNGLSAAAGKLGALTGATLFVPAAAKLGDGNVMILCGCIGCVAFLITFLFVKPQSSHPIAQVTIVNSPQVPAETEEP